MLETFLVSVLGAATIGAVAIVATVVIVAVVVGNLIAKAVNK